MNISKHKKDGVALFIILYIGAFCFWLGFRNSVYDGFDLFLFIGIFVFMCISPVLVVLLYDKFVGGVVDG